MRLEPPLQARDGEPSTQPERRPVSAPASGRARTAARRLLPLLGLVVVWGLLMRGFGSSGDIYAVLGSFALGVLLVVAASARAELGAWLRPSTSAVLSGLGVGVVMTLATYPAYALLVSLAPSLESEVSALYVAAHQTTLAEALPWVLAIIVAEELLWRGALLHALERHTSPALAMLISVATYAAAQLGTGSWIVMLLALVCGALWTAQRHFTRSLLSPLLAHLIWTPTLILLYPVA